MQAAKRALFVLGLLSRYAFDMIAEDKKDGVTLEQVTQIFKDYLKIADLDLMTRALQVLVTLPVGCYLPFCWVQLSDTGLRREYGNSFWC